MLYEEQASARIVSAHARRTTRQVLYKLLSEIRKLPKTTMDPVR